MRKNPTQFELVNLCDDDDDEPMVGLFKKKLVSQ